MLASLKLKLRSLAYPTYECEDCIGMRQYGCYCSYYDCVGPGKKPERWRLALRKFLEYTHWHYI